MELLSCPLCMKPHFEGVDELRVSLITVATSQISCPVCEETLMGLDKLTIHLFSHITHNLVQESFMKPPENPPESPHNINDNLHENSKEVDNLQEVRNSQKVMEVDNYSDIIEKSILTVKPTEEKSSKKTMRCDICNFCFSDENILDMHQKLLHQTQADTKTGQYGYHCHLCSKKFKMRGSLMVHLRVAHYGFGHDTQISSDEPGIFAHVQNGDALKDEKPERNTDGKQWVCEVCTKQFTTKYFLKKHKRLHTGEMPYFCAQCNKSFTFQQSYHKHMLYHTSEKPHLCSECGRAFKELSTLHNHERIHSGERPFVCETCGKSFRQRVSYLVHRRIHTGVMPYKCTACDKSFRYKVSQKSHKCPVNPPGSVIRAPALVEKLIQKHIGKSQEEPPDAENLENTSQVLQHRIQSSAKPFDVTRNCNIYNQQKNIIESADQIHNSLIKLDDKQENLKNNVATDLLIGPAIVSLDNSVKFNNTVNTIIVNSGGQIIGQNFNFDGQNIITITHKLETNDCLSNLNEVKSETVICDVPENNLYQKRDQNNCEIPPLQISTEIDTTTFENNNKNPDFLSMILSPGMPDVQSLCLSNSSSSDNEDCPSKPPLETINEETFKKLLDGLSDCM